MDGDILLSDSQELMEDLLQEYFSIDMAAMSDLRSSYGMDSLASSMGGGSMVLWQEMLPGDDGALSAPCWRTSTTWCTAPGPTTTTR